MNTHRQRSVQQSALSTLQVMQALEPAVFEEVQSRKRKEGEDEDPAKRNWAAIARKAATHDRSLSVVCLLSTVTSHFGRDPPDDFPFTFT
jgi:hypothetical protein